MAALPARPDLRPNARLSYETLSRLHLLPYLGDRPLSKITRSDCDSLYVRLQSPNAATGRPLSLDPWSDALGNAAGATHRAA
jgi:hypothetical protein